MKVILDTNVFVSGIFFSGPPYKILEAWREKRVTLVVSPAILDEYRRVAEDLADKFPGVDIEPVLELLAIHALLVDAPDLPDQVCTDADDDMFLACAIASGANIITSGDKALLRTSGYAGIQVIPPSTFVSKFL